MSTPTNISQTVHNYNYAPGIATYGQTGETGQAGQDGNNIYYTNINFTDKQKEDENKLYDMFKSNGLMDEIIKNIPEDEYNMLYNYLLDEAKNRIKSRRSVVGLIQSLINDLPTQAEAAKKIMDDFDPQKFQEVINFAKAANGGRDI